MYGKEKGLQSFTSTIRKVLGVMPSSKDQAALTSSLFNVWEENILSLGEGLQEDLGIIVIVVTTNIIKCCIPFFLKNDNQVYTVKVFSTSTGIILASFMLSVSGGNQKKWVNKASKGKIREVQ